MALNWILDSVPGWLGPTSVVVGLLLCSLSLLRQSKQELISDVVSPKDYFLLSLAGVTFIWAVTNLLQVPAFFVRYATVYTALFIFASRWIEGAGAVLLYQKVSYVVSNRSLPETSLREKMAKRLTLLLLAVILIYAGIGALIFTALSLPLAEIFLVVWTVATFLTSLLGLSWKVSTVSQGLPKALLWGTLLILAGSEVVNLATTSAEIRVFIAGGLGYTLGYLTTLVLWASDFGSDTDTYQSRSSR